MMGQFFTLLLLPLLVAGFEIFGGASRERSFMIVVVLPLLAWILWTIFRFSRADGDLSLLSKSAPPIDAFKDKVVWITGASQGIGKNVPHDVMMLHLDINAGEAVMNEVVEKADSAFNGNGVDIMVHSAAYTRPASFSVNVLGTIILARFLAQKMVSRGH